jgi:negative regulator of flagellin synthesis FlgM
MTGITDLNAVFNPSTQVSGSDADALSLTGTNQSTISSADNQSLLSMDQTVVSSTGDAMLQAMGTSDVRSDKVASLQAAIATGTYNVSSSDVADKLIDSMLGRG